MIVDVAPCTDEDRGRLLALLELYVYDFSELLGLDVGEDGRFAHPRIYEPGEVLHTALLPGFGLELARIFPDQGEEPGTQA